MTRIVPLLPASVRRFYRKLFPHEGVDFAALWEKSCQKWAIGGVEIVDGWIIVHGWLIAPDQLRPHVSFLLNGEGFTSEEYPLPRPDVEQQKGSCTPWAFSSGFMLARPLPNLAPYHGDLTLTAIDRRTRAPLGVDYRSLHVPAPERLGTLPDGHHIRRVIGEDSAFNFASGGYTAYLELRNAVLESTGQDLSDFSTILDWGCGCARISRYFLQQPGIQVTGVDVDPENIAWCQSHLAAGHWRVIPLRPPTQLPSATYDMAIGISVFTHLKENDQLSWLAELQRIIRPGGLALMTFHGEASIVWARLSAERYAVLNRDGFCHQENPLYDAQLSEKDYYRDSFHTAEYVQRIWGQFFEIVRIFPSHIAHQDLVVMRRREGTA